MRHVAIAIACAAFLCGACTKSDKKTDQPAEGEPTTAEKPVERPPEAAPAGAPPPGAADLCTESTKDDFEALALDQAPAKAPAAAAPVDPQAIGKDGIPTMEVRGLSGAEMTGFRVSYADSTNPLHQQFAAILKEVKLYEQIATALNATIRLPRTIDIQLVDCGTVNAFYDPNNSRLIMCWELMSYFAEMFKPVAKDTDELGNAILGATIFAFFHEAGHGLIHQLKLPAVGRQEDAVDQFATLILIAGGDESVAMALSGAYWFQLQSQQGHETPFYDEHAFDAQRFYNILCLIYGSDPQKYADFVSSGTLPEMRARRCPQEFAEIKEAWDQLLKPHLTEQGAQNVDIATDPPPATTTTTTTTASSITCEQIAEKVTALVIAQLDEQYKDATQAEIDAVVEQLQVQLPQMQQQILDECAQASWSDASRRCVLDAKTIDDASKCN